MGNLFSLTINTEATFFRCWDCVAGQARYTCKLKQNLKALSMELETLTARRDDVNQRVVFAQQQHRRCLNEVQLWLNKVGTMIAEVEELIQKGDQEKQKLCLAGCFSMNCRSSYNFGREVARKLEAIVPLWNEGVFEQVPYQNELEASVDARPAAPTVGLESTFNEVCSLLERKEVGMIGLHGLGGVGKTTLLTQIYNKLLSNNVPDCYDAIIWVVVSKGYTIENLQAKIGESLHLPMESWNYKSSDKKSQEIHRALSGKKFVLFLDDIWGHVDLIKVGVPSPNEENGSKVVFTTRLSDVCSQMGADEKIEVRCLGEDEAWALFQKNVGEDTLNSHPDIREIAKDVAAECRGLPLALIMIGRAMAGKKSNKSWQYAIKLLRDSAHSFAKEAPELFSVLKFSYDNLPSNTMRSCLLYCCLYPEDYSIEKTSLVEYWFCEGLLTNFQSMSIRDARLEGHHIIDSLINASLLEEDGEHSVKMHDVIRDMTTWISRECVAVEERFFVQAGLQLTTTPAVGRWEGAKRVSFMKNRIDCLTSTPKCPHLQTLFLNNNYYLSWNIEMDFFRSMPKLRVLNLSACGALKELPRGISNLVSLECLDLSYTNIRELPKELERLTELKYLDLRWVGKVIIIPGGLISSFSKLQVFRLYSSIEHEGAVWIGGEDEGGLIEELASLQHLNEIWIEMKGASALQRLLSFDNLQRSIEALRLFNFSESEVFNVSYYLENMESLKYLSLYNCETVEEMIQMKIEIGREREGGKGRMLDSLESVELRNCRKLRDMTWLKQAPNLRNLKVWDCAKMENIIFCPPSENIQSFFIARLGLVGEYSREGEVEDLPFPKLERLELESLPELKSIYPRALPFPFLTEVEIRSCPKLKKLPLDSDSAMGNNLTIQGDTIWWGEIEWEDATPRILHSFIPIPKLESEQSSVLA